MDDPLIKIKLYPKKIHFVLYKKHILIFNLKTITINYDSIKWV